MISGPVPLGVPEGAHTGPPNCGAHMEHPLDRLTRLYPSIRWKFDDGKTRVKWTHALIGDSPADAYLFNTTKAGEVWCISKLPCSDLKRHTCEFCQRRGHRGLIQEAFFLDRRGLVIACIGCISRYDALRRKEQQLEELARLARRTIRNLPKGKDHATPKNHA